MKRADQPERSGFPWKMLALAALLGLIWAFGYYLAFNVRTAGNPVYDGAIAAVVILGAGALYMFRPSRRRARNGAPKDKRKD